MMTDVQHISQDRFTGHFIAYFDILGYAQYIRKENKAVEIVNAIKSIIHQIRNNEEVQGSKNYSDGEVKLKVFSDNFIICSERNWQLIMEIAFILQIEFAKKNILIRGGMTYGMLYFDDEFLCGEGIIEAYELESQVAIYPRVVIEKIYLEKAKEEVRRYVQNIMNEDALKGETLGRQADEFENFLRECTLEDFDGVKFVHYLSRRAFAHYIYQLGYDAGRYEAERDGFLKVHGEHIEANLATENLKIKAKYSWAKNYYTKACRE